MTCQVGAGGIELAIDADDVVVERRTTGRVIRALDGMTLRIPTGSFVTILGPNGAGKSTLLASLVGLLSPTSGTLTVLGHSLPRQAQAVLRELGMVFQAPALDELLTIRENLVLQGETSGLGRAEAAPRAEALIDALDLAPIASRRCGHLSGGQQRRADLARALVTDPSLMILDEPCTGLDPDARRSFLDLMGTLRAERPTRTIVMTTHAVEDAERGNLVALIDAGRCVCLDSPDSLRASAGRWSLRVESPASGESRQSLIAEITSSGFEPHERGSQLVLFADAERLAELRALSDRLLDRRVTLSLGPPTLEDVYVARTGRQLADAGEGAA